MYMLAVARQALAMLTQNGCKPATLTGNAPNITDHGSPLDPKTWKATSNNWTTSDKIALLR